MVLAWHDVSGPAPVSVRAKNERRGVARATFHRHGLDPLAVNLAADAFASKGALVVGKVEAQLLALLLHRHRKARDVGNKAVSPLQEQQLASHIWAIERTRDPKAFQVQRSGGLSRGGHNQERGTRKPAS